MEDLYLEPTFSFLVCKVHGYGIHPTKAGITRHLRGEGHYCRGNALKQAVSTLTSLPLASLESLRAKQPAVDTQPIAPPLGHLKVLRGWYCLPCTGRFLTTSVELVQRHAATEHGRRRGEPELWEVCELQTFFSETKDRRYFRVTRLSGTTEESNADGGHHRSDYLTGESPSLNKSDDAATCTTSCSTSLAGRFPARRSICDPMITEVSATLPSPSQPASLCARPARSITFSHPLTALAVKHVRLAPYRLDHLFKSDAFRTASEPLFDTSHVDSPRNMHAVFPNSAQEPAFFNALLYSIIQITNRGRPTIEGFTLQTRTFALLNEKLASPVMTISSADIGAIMLLKTTAYKTFDLVAHDAHTRGLATVLKASSTRESGLTPAAKRAVFWVDLLANVLVDSKRWMCHTDLPQKLVWNREKLPEPDSTALPAGFDRLRQDLPFGLLECVLDTVELQNYQEATDHVSPSARYYRLDAMQASIESRLGLVAQDCRKRGVLAEAVRLAVFMCCYCSWMEIWNDSLIPCRVAQSLLDILEPTLFDMHLSGREKSENGGSELAKPAKSAAQASGSLYTTASESTESPSSVKTLSTPGSSTMPMSKIADEAGSQDRRSDDDECRKESVWTQYIDVLLWLLLVSASVVQLDQGHVKDLKAMQKRLFALARTLFTHQSSVDMEESLERALQHFIYSNGWLKQRFHIKDWFEIEVSIGAVRKSVNSYQSP